MEERIEKFILVIRKNFFVRAGLLITLLLIFIFLFLIPTLVGTKSLAHEVDGLYAANQQIQDEILSSGHSGQKLESIQKLLHNYERMIRPRTELSDILNKIASKAQEYGLEVLTLKPLRNTPYPGDAEALLKNPDEKVYEVVISMTAKGHFLELG